MILTKDKHLAVRVGVDGVSKMRVFDLSDVYEAQDRIEEVAFVTPHKAPELLAYFNKVWLKVDEISNLLEMEMAEAKKNVAVKRSEIILDRCEAIFKEKGLKASADLRQAVVDADPDYITLVDIQNSLEAAIAFLSGKQKGIEMAYGSVRKILGESTYNMRNGSGNVGNVENPNDQSIRNNFGKTHNYVD